MLERNEASHRALTICSLPENTGLFCKRAL